MLGASVFACVLPACRDWALPGSSRSAWALQASSPHPHPAGMQQGSLSGAVAPKHRLVLETVLLLQCRLYISQDTSVSMETAVEQSCDSCPGAPLCLRSWPCPSPSAPRPAQPAFPGFCFYFLTCTSHRCSQGMSQVPRCWTILSSYLPASRLLCFSWLGLLPPGSL